MNMIQELKNAKTKLSLAENAILLEIFLLDKISRYYYLSVIVFQCAL